ncbi:GTP cyclohydrolase-2 [Neptunitalea chrysea]|uniref:GTP cyclohydrolase-2 n=1 Tax=Neptunitalea chrysea TaxID=1647581 RepID=A0A9W6EUU8_9FLAO|nr:GTP cyclohydrolase II [Neptunitalea chrysea]GLB53945.1 GTP cyclohydrolase-2 [Neptunitalea chrysea]
MLLHKEKVKFSNTAKLPTKYGLFNIVSFKEDSSEKEHLIVTMGNLMAKENVLTRVHSECLTGDVFTSLKCDCGEQLEASMKLIAEKKEGIIIYLKQEGRGIGLFNKVNAYALQDKGQDTIAANHSLGFDTDLRTFDIVANVINFLGVASIKLLTNNPEKVNTISKSTGILTSVQPLRTKPNKYNLGYLTIKKQQLKHAL